MLKLETALAEIKGLPPRFLSCLRRLGLYTVRDLLWHFPVRYEDFSKIYRIAELEPNQFATVQGVIQEIGTRRSLRRRRMTITEALVGDSTGSMRVVWFNQPYLSQTLSRGKRVSLAGKVLESDQGLYFSSPTFEVLNRHREDTIHTAGLIAIYPETRGLTSKGIRYLIKAILKNLPSLDDPLPPSIRTSCDILELNKALRAIHFPSSAAEAEKAKKRFSFEELFMLQLSNLLQRQRLARELAPVCKISEEELARYLLSLPFTLTADQSKALAQIIKDLSKPTPMNRLLQGDVGSGKTAVAALSAMVVAKNGYQTALMAPTEVLAQQHFQTFKTLLAKFEITAALLTANDAEIYYGEDLENKITKQKLKKEIERGAVSIVIGTHALIESSTTFKNLGLVIIDEQHRFGVEQRAALARRKDTIPHFLSMSATPIPRTLMLALFGDLDISIITELPKGRRPVITKIVPPEMRSRAYGFIREEIKRGRQAFVICPRIEQNMPESKEEKTDKRAALWQDVKAVQEEYEKLSKKIFPDLRVSMLHGKLKPKEKEAIMTAFKNRQSDILVSTSVVEVGVDVPNATIMMIESADRFGLAQLYQFRGRVGRGAHQSYCLLFTDSSASSVLVRLKALLESKNGFELAERDLALRGPGQFLGEKQSGLPDIAMASLSNLELIREARFAASKLLEENPSLDNQLVLKKRLQEFKNSVHLE